MLINQGPWTKDGTRLKDIQFTLITAIKPILKGDRIGIKGEAASLTHFRHILKKYSSVYTNIQFPLDIY